MTEIWKDIKGWESLYQVSNLGNVKSLKKYGDVKERILKPQKISHGYLMVHLCDKEKKRQYYIHRLVAEAFIPNPLNLPEVNHKDECKYNNDVTNLEWCTRKYNINYGTAIQRMADKISKAVNQYTLSGVFIKQWVSTYSIERELGYYHGNITRCCKGKYKSIGGFKWYYADDPVQYIDQPLW